MKQDESAMQGLSEQEAGQKLRQHGYNELAARQQRTVLHIVLEVIREPMFLLLIGAGTIYLLLGDLSDALMLLAFVMLAMLITIYQERRTERVLETLKELSSPRALVVRGGLQVRIPGREVVPGDLLVLEEGDRIAADGEVIECHDLLIDESMLSGESVAVAKQAEGATRQGGGNGMVYSGTMIVQGSGLARVIATGNDTALGKIGKTLQSLDPGKSLLQLEIAGLVKRFAFFAVVLSLLVLLLYGWTRGDWLNGLLAGITLAMSILPEEFTVILTVFMALGAWRISKNHVLTRHTPVIEALGSINVLCVDKTGTLTQNRMSVKTVVIDHHEFSIGTQQADTLPEAVYRLLACSVLASEPMPFDPMEQAFHRCLATLYPSAHAAHGSLSFIHEYALSAEIRAMTHVWQAPDEAACLVATKGAPESVARLCKLDAKATADMLQQVEVLAARGQRVLAVAQARYAAPTNAGDSKAAWPERPDGFDFAWLGLVSLADPLRAEVPQAVSECQQAGIRVVMITGDYPATAQAIAREAGLPWQKVVTGAQLDSLDETALKDMVRDTHVFARILPEQKLRLVNAFKADGLIVAMTGDGVNDAPALKAAHVGIAMGKRGTDVAREAASLVLLNDDFASIVHAIRLGRRIYVNLRKSMTYVVAVHFPIVGMTLLPLMTGAPLAFFPVHVVFLEMIINPACAIVFETEDAEKNNMRSPPRSIAEKLFGKKNVLLALLQGMGLLAAVAALFFGGLEAGLQQGQARTLAFAGIVVGNLALIIANRSVSAPLAAIMRIPNAAQWWVIGSTLIALLLSLYVPGLQEVFHLSRLDERYFIFPLLAAMTVIAWAELMKFAFRHWREEDSPRHANEAG